MSKLLSRLFSYNLHCYTVYNEAEHKYFNEDFATREEAKCALYQYLRANHISVLYTDELTHCKQYICDNGQSFYINREY